MNLKFNGDWRIGKLFNYLTSDAGISGVHSVEFQVETVVNPNDLRLTIDAVNPDILNI